MPTHYDVLEVAPTASQEVVEAAYKVLIKKHHPDKKATIEGTVARALNTAREVLSDPVKRATYDASLTLSGSVLGGRWRVLSPIAEGGFGKTYRGEHVLTGGLVCVKHCSRISPADAAVLVDEAKAMWDLRHFAVPAVRDLLKLDDGSLALVQSFVEGPTLQEVVEVYAKRGEKLPPEHVAWMTSRVLNALSYIHRHGVVHGDLKPQNIVVQPVEHSLSLVDFGLAAVKPKKADGSRGYTDLFSPPEQVSGKPLLPQSDYYSLGMTMLHALCGGDRAAVEGRKVPVTTPDPLCKFVLRLLVRDPLGRPDYATEDLWTTFEGVRTASFGRAASGMLPLKL